MNNANLRIGLTAAAIFVAGAGIYTKLLPSHRQPPAPQTQTIQPPPAAAQTLTPFQKNPFLFSSFQEAVKALRSQDMLQRRSGIEWLGQYTLTYTTYGVSASDSAGQELQKHPEIVPDLIRAVQEMPDDDSRQAARLLVFFGQPGQPAIAAVCAALASPRYGSGKPYDSKFVERGDLLNSLVHLCGGPDRLGPALVKMLNAPEPDWRTAAASAVSFCGDPTFRHQSPPPQGAYHWFDAKQEGQWRTAFSTLLVPALAARLTDPVRAVRLASLAGLESLTYYSANPAWKAALGPLAGAASSSDPAIRLAALRVLAYAPVDVSSVTPTLRAGLHGTPEEKGYALSALFHAAQTNRALTASSFLGDLASPAVQNRRLGANDINQTVILLLDGSFWPEPDPIPNWYNDSRLMMAPEPAGLTPAQRPALMAARAAAEIAFQPQLLAALVKAALDPDHQVRVDTAASLLQIGDWTNAMLGRGISNNPGDRLEPQVAFALTQAAAALQNTEPAEAERLLSLEERIQQPHDRA